MLLYKHSHLVFTTITIYEIQKSILVNKSTIGKLKFLLCFNKRSDKTCNIDTRERERGGGEREGERKGERKREKKSERDRVECVCVFI